MNGNSLRFAAMIVLVLSGGMVLHGCGGGGGNGGGGDTTNSGGGGGVPQFVSIGTAPVGGAFYNVGSAISDVLDQNSKTGGWRKSTAESTGGSLENLRRLDSDEIQLAMSNSSITYFAVRGEGGFEKKHDVKSVMTLFPLVAMFVTKQGSGIESIADLKGKRVVIGPEGAGFEYFVRPVLEEHGVSMDDFEDVYAGMQTSVGYLQDESVQATFLGGGMKSPAISSAASSMDIKLVPFGAEERKAIAAKYPSFNEVTVPAETYRGQSEDFAGLNVGSAHLIVRSDASDDFVYNVAKIIYESRDKLAQTHAAAKAINDKNVARPTGTDFHPGAIKFYKEIGLWPSEDGKKPESSEEPEPAAEGNDS